MIERIMMLLFCHFMGDYVLQNDFLAKTKGTNWWHLFAHCMLYALPFYLAFGSGWRILALMLFHAFIDTAKARYHMIGYAADQALHLLILIPLYFMTDNMLIAVGNLLLFLV